MTNKKSTKRALLFSVLSLVLCFSMLVGTTFAWFTDSVTSANNIIASGNLDVELYYMADGVANWTKVDENTNVFIDGALWEPGHVEVVKLKVVNEGSLALKYNLSVNVDDEEAFENMNGDTVKLSSFIKYAIIDGEKDYTRDEAVAAAEAAGATALNAAFETGAIDLEASASKIVTMVVYMPTTVGNDANAKDKNKTGSIDLGINLVATQTEAESDAFGPDYDADLVPEADFYATDAAELAAAIEEGGVVALRSDIDLSAVVTYAATASDPTLKIPAGKNVVIDLNGYTLSATSTQTGKNYNMIDVNGGTLTVKNGTIVTKHTGTNMGWSNSTNVFNVTAGGVLNLEDVVAKNLGGSDMAFVAHLNNWGEVTLNVNNCDLSSTYTAVRVFNSGYDMNNVNITNSTLIGVSSSVWVHNATVEDFGTQEKAEAQAKLLNFNFVTDGAINADANNTFVGRIRYGFTNSTSIDGFANTQAVANAEKLSEALSDDKDLVLVSDIAVTGSKQPDRNNYVEAYGNKVGFAQYTGVIDGNGNTVTDAEGDKSYLIVTHGGTIKNLTIRSGARGIVTYAPTEDVYIDNVVVDGAGYALNSTEHGAVKMVVTNSTINGWTSLAGFTKVEITNCKLGENTLKYWQGMGYGQDYDRLFRVYSPTFFTDCEFEQGYYLDLSAGGTATLVNCTVNGVVITAENYANYITIELPSGVALADCVAFN